MQARMRDFRKKDGQLYSFDRMDFQQTGKQDDAGRFERGYLKVTTENLPNRDLPGCEKPPESNEQRCPKPRKRLE